VLDEKVRKRLDFLVKQLYHVFADVFREETHFELNPEILNQSLNVEGVFFRICMLHC